jgi:hypothetical protein
MPAQPIFRAHFSAASSSLAPTPRLRTFSPTTKPFTSARGSTSSKGVTLTCTQPITSSSPVSATKHAPFLWCNVRFKRAAICFAVTGYPSCPESAAIRGASASFALRTFISDWPADIWVHAPFWRKRFCTASLFNSRSASAAIHRAARVPLFWILPAQEIALRFKL